MKLGISYNVFDGEELLESSIRYIRDNVDYVSVVYQEVSNFGDKCSDDLVNILNRLVEKKYIDELYKYVPEIHNELSDRNQDQEVLKRNIGLELSRKNNCTHHMSIDVDEFYIPEQFEYMKTEVEKGSYDASACKHNQYYKDSIYMILPKEEEYVSTIYKINPDTKYILGQKCIVPIDPSRKTNNENYRIFSRQEIEMHHMSFVRKNLRKKYMNHTSRTDIYDKIDKVVDYYEKWQYPMPAMWAGGNMLQVVKIDRIFDVYNEKDNE